MSGKYCSLAICFSYGMLSFLQTVNSKYLYKNLSFEFYSFTFAIQRILTVIILSALGYARFRKKQIIAVIPFSLLMCAINLLSSYCISIMPLGTFAAFKKLTILFVLIVGVLMKVPLRFWTGQYICMALIGIGAIFVGLPDFADGNVIGYLACIGYNLSQALSLQYSNYLSRQKKFAPIDLLYYNSLVSFPYYILIVLVSNQTPQIVDYFGTAPATFYFPFFMMLTLGCTTQLIANYVTMKISPFEKATISNIKDIFVVFVSIKYFHDFILFPIAVFGSILVFVGSIMFSMPVCQEKKQLSIPQSDDIEDQDQFTVENTRLISIDPKSATLNCQTSDSD